MVDTVCVFLKDDKERIIFIYNFVAGSKSVRSKQMAGYFLELYIYIYEIEAEYRFSKEELGVLHEFYTTLEAFSSVSSSKDRL